MGITVLPPDVNESGILFTPRLAGGTDGAIRQTALAGAPLEAAQADKPLEAAETAAAYDVEVSSAAKTSAPAAEEGLQGVIRFGLAAIKNVGTQAMESILRERRERPFDSLLDFCR